MTNLSKFTFCVLTLCASTAFAQDNTLDTIIVSATKNPQKIKNIGSTVTILDRFTLEQRGDRNLIDALKRVPGLTLSRAGGVGSVANVRLRGSDPDQSLVLVDGINISDTSGVEHAFDFGSIQIHAIERIEILKGNQSALYGSNAIGGVINIITKRATTNGQSGTAFIEGGSYGAFNTGFSIYHKDDVIATNLNASYFREDGISRRQLGSERDASQVKNLSGAIKFTPNDDMNFDLSVQHRNTNSEFDPFGADGNADFDRDFLTGRLKAEILGFNQALKNSFTIGGTQTERYSFDGLSRDSFDSQRRFGSYQADLSLLNRDVATLGAEYEYEEADISGNFIQNRERGSIYGQYLLGLGEDITLTLGGRIDDYDNYGVQETFRTALAYNIPLSGTTIRASYGTGFNAPSLYQLYENTFGIGNANLSPEKSKGFDIGFEQVFPGNYVTLGATFFENDIENLIVFSGGNYQNINKANVSGVETFIQIDPSEYVSIFANYTLTDAQDVMTGGELPRRPRHTASAGLDIYPNDALHIGLLGHFVGNQLDSNFSGRNKSYFTMDANISYDISDDINLYGRVDNIFDREFTEVLGFNTPGITGFGGVRFKF